MRARAVWIVIALVVSCVLCGCQTALVRKADQDALCGASVVAHSNLVAFKPNPLADPVGGPALGTGMGALAAIAAIGNPIYLFVVPMAVGSGIACGEGARTHPTADADFRRIFSSADIDALRRSLAEEIDRPREGCRLPPGERPAPAATIVIERIEAIPGCAAGDWVYAVDVSWRAARPDGSELVPLRKSGCRESTFRDVDTWFANPELDRAEVEEVLAATGRRIASDLLSDTPPDPQCFLSTLNGKVTPQ